MGGLSLDPQSADEKPSMTVHAYSLNTRRQRQAGLRSSSVNQWSHLVHSRSSRETLHQRIRWRALKEDPPFWSQTLNVPKGRIYCCLFIFDLEVRFDVAQVNLDLPMWLKVTLNVQPLLTSLYESW